MSPLEFAFLWNSSTYITRNWGWRNVFISFRFCLKIINLHHLKLRLNKCLHKNSVLFETPKHIELQTETQTMSSEEFTLVWSSPTYITSNWELKYVSVSIPFFLQFINLHNSKLRLKKCLHQTSLLFQTHQPT